MSNIVSHGVHDYADHNYTLRSRDLTNVPVNIYHPEERVTSDCHQEPEE